MTLRNLPSHSLEFGQTDLTIYSRHPQLRDSLRRCPRIRSTGVLGLGLGWLPRIPEVDRRVRLHYHRRCSKLEVKEADNCDDLLVRRRIHCILPSSERGRLAFPTYADILGLDFPGLITMKVDTPGRSTPREIRLLKKATNTSTYNIITFATVSPPRKFSSNIARQSTKQLIRWPSLSTVSSTND